jgi:hypothetical protein
MSVGQTNQGGRQPTNSNVEGWGGWLLSNQYLGWLVVQTSKRWLDGWVLVVHYELTGFAQKRRSSRPVPATLGSGLGVIPPRCRSNITWQPNNRLFNLPHFRLLGCLYNRSCGWLVAKTTNSNLVAHLVGCRPPWTLAGDIQLCLADGNRGLKVCDR